MNHVDPDPLTGAAASADGAGQRRVATVRRFQRRVLQALERSGLSRAALAAAAGVDRSTLTQLLARDTLRLPRADTVAGVARALGVSADWLLGLSGDARPAGSVLSDGLEVALRPAMPTPMDEHLTRWHEEASGYKIRFVSSDLPDLLKTGPVLQYEYQLEVSKTPDQAIATSQSRLAYLRSPESDMEVCVSRQSLEAFARGEGVWRDLPAPLRRAQLEHMARLVDDLYPGLRVYAYDGLRHYSAPYTVFGPIRVALYIGQMYLVFSTSEHVRLMTRHFDQLVRAAVIQADAMARVMRDLAQAVR